MNLRSEVGIFVDIWKKFNFGQCFEFECSEFLIISLISKRDFCSRTSFGTILGVSIVFFLYF